MAEFCYGCKTFKDIVYTDEGTHRSFCGACVRATPPSPEELALAFVLATIPFKPGDRVEYRFAGGTESEVLEGIGTVQEVSMSLEHGGTPVFPAFRVTIDEKAHPEAPDEEWAPECCLTKVDA